MKALRLIIVVLFSVIIYTNAEAQDIDFTMYSNTALNINPGIISSDDHLKVVANYRNKSYINDINKQSTYLMLSRPLFKDNNRFGGLGISVLSDKGGDAQLFSYEGVTGAYAHEVQLSSWSRLSLGLQVAYFMKRIDSQQFSTGSQWVDGVGYDPTINNGETFESTSTGNFTMSSGLFWYIPNQDRTLKFYLGFAMYNLNKPTYSFFGTEEADPMKYVAHAGYEVYSKGNFSIMPHALYSNSFYTHHVTVGSNWKYKFKVKNQNWLLSSGSIDLITDYRLNEGIAAGVQVNQPDFSFGIAYGFANNFSGDFTPEKEIVEISFTYRKSLFKKRTEKKVIETQGSYDRSEVRNFVFEEPEVVEEVEDIKTEIKKETGKEIKFKLEKDFQFGFNMADLNDEARAYINDIVILLSENEMLNIEIIGHTDNVGTRAANQKISEERAAVVKAYLLEKGIQEDRITTKGMADDKPKFNNDTKENRAKNRRVEFVIYY